MAEIKWKGDTNGGLYIRKPPFICDKCQKEIKGGEGYIRQFEPDGYPSLYHYKCWRKL